MWHWLKRAGRRSTGSTEPAATLAVFGKHPGWDDHMPDFALGSETLAELKQNLYVAGIGGQIDSGAWERLEPAKRLDGFDHTFLWIQGGHNVLGRLWSSTDRKGRAKYPMGAYIQLQNLRLEAVLETARLILDQVRDACKSTTSADQVMASCRAAQDQLNQWMAQAGTGPGKTVIRPEDARQFLQAPAFQPDSLGLLRVLHELDNALGPQLSGTFESAKSTEWQSYHVRVPLCAPSAHQGLLLWSRFLRCSLPDTVPLLLLVRDRTDWLDVVIGNPAGGGLFCLQASMDALPLTTEIPYDIAPALAARLKTIASCFLGEPWTAADKAPDAGPAPVPVPKLETSSPQVATQSRRGTQIWLGLGLVGLASLCVALTLWMRPRAATPIARNTVPEIDSRAAERARLERQAAELEQHYSLALEEARAAFAKGDYSNALARADAALALKTNDVQATQLKTDAQSEQSFRSLLKLAQDAYDRADYPEALKQVKQAAKIRSGDAAVVTLKEASSRELAKRQKEAELERQYSEAVEAGRTALQQRDYPAAAAQAEKALRIKPSGTEATQIGLSARQEQAYAAATTAFAQGDYSRALSQSQLFQGTERFDRLHEQIAQEQSQLKQLQQALQQGRYDVILAGTWPTKPDFQKVTAAATDENQKLEEARRKLASGDYSYVQSMAQANYRTKPAFAALLESGRAESDALDALRRSKEAGDRATAREALAKLSPELRRKDAFKELDKWAAQEVELPRPATSPPPASEAPAPAKIAHFENVLRKLEIRFGTKDPDPQIVEDGHPVLRETNISKAKRTEAYARVRYLRDYRTDGWLTDERKSRLEKLEEAIRNSKE